MLKVVLDPVSSKGQAVAGANNKGRFQYMGQIWIEEIALYHYKARSYNPILGRFMQTDPIGYADGMNLYAYVDGDPINGSDTTGLCDSQITCNPSDYIIVLGSSTWGFGGLGNGWRDPIGACGPTCWTYDGSGSNGNSGELVGSLSLSLGGGVVSTGGGGRASAPPAQQEQAQEGEEKKKKKKCLVGEIDISVGFQGGFIVELGDILKGGILLDLGFARATGNSRTGSSRTVTQDGLVSLGASIPGTGLSVGRALQAGYAVPYGDTSA